LQPSTPNPGVRAEARPFRPFHRAAALVALALTVAACSIAPAPGEADPNVGGGAGPTPLASDWVCAETPLAPAYEPTLFVAPDGSDANDGRSLDRPLRTLAAAATRVVPGDVVWLRDGVYAAGADLSRSGSADAPIVIESHPGECAILDGSTDGRLTISGARHLLLRNLIVRDSPAEGVLLQNASDVTLSNLRVHGSYYSGITNIGGSRNTFRYVVAHDNVDHASGGDADGISISSGDGHRIERCLVYGNSDDGVDTWRSTGTLVERCVAFDNGRLAGDGNGIKAGGGSEVVRTVVRESVAFGNRANGFDHNSGVDVRFDHNTAYGNGGLGFVAGDSVLRNNLAFGNARGDWTSGPYGNDEVTNSWNLGVAGDAVVSSDPQDDAFLALHPDGPAADAGTPVGVPYEGEAPHLGALPESATLTSFLGVDPTEAALP
jgi:hypothetical protein